MPSEITETRIKTLVAMLEQTYQSRDPLVRLRILAEAQYQLGWALREAVVDADEAGKTWAQIGEAIELPRQSAWRQYKAGGPLVVVKAYQSVDSPLADSERGPTTDTAVYAFRAEDGDWFGPVDGLEYDDFDTGWLAFDPPIAPGSKFAGEELLVRYGPWDEEASFFAPLIRDSPTGELRRVRATHEVIDWLFGDGQVAVRQAMTAVAQARAVIPSVDRKLSEVIHLATVAQGRLDSPQAFIDAAERVAEHGQLGYRSGLQIKDALERLERAVQQYRAWQHRGTGVTT
jgi:hypothetical protein